MTPTAAEIQDWMVARVARATGLTPGEIDPRDPLTRHGLDSAAVLTIAGELEEWLGYRFRANPFEDHPTIASLATFLAEEVARCRSSGPN